MPAYLYYKYFPNQTVILIYFRFIAKYFNQNISKLDICSKIRNIIYETYIESQFHRSFIINIKFYRINIILVRIKFQTIIHYQ